MPILQNATELFLHTSNILKWNTMDILKNPSDEVAKCIEALLHCWHPCQCDEKLSKEKEIIATCEKHRDPIPESERHDIHVTAKLFLFNDDPDSVEQAVIRTLDRLCLDDIETLIISLAPGVSQDPLVNHPPCLGLSGTQVPEGTAASLLKLWPVLEKFVHSNRVFRLGVCDMPVDQLEILCSLVEIPPKVNQVSLGATCLLGDDVQKFAKQHDIQLTTHQDNADILPEEKLRSIISNEFTPADGVGWRPSWLVRYSELYQQRGVVRSKGYTFFAERKLEI